MASKQLKDKKGKKMLNVKIERNEDNKGLH